MGFASWNFHRIEGNTTSVNAGVFGEAVRDYQIIYIQGTYMYIYMYVYTEYQGQAFADASDLLQTRCSVYTRLTQNRVFPSRD